QSPWFKILVFILISMAGLPLLAYLRQVGSSLTRRRWRRLCVLVGLTALVAVVVGALWLWADMRTMGTLEHYTCSGWYLLAMPIAYGMGVVVLIAQPVRGLARLVRRLGLRVLSRPV